ncbi:MAG: DUF951 domain-containing protein [Bacilli bacterium]
MSNYNLYDCVEMKKPHPCGHENKKFQIVRMGADIKIKCLACGNVIMLPRDVFDQKLRKVIPFEENNKFITKNPNSTSLK